MAEDLRGFRAAKCFEGNGPFVIWSVSGQGPDHQSRKFHLVADATQRTFGVRVEPSRTDDVKANGAVVGLLRKHARTAGIGRVFRDPATGHIWLPLFTTRGARPDFWVQLAKVVPPEVRLVDATGDALVRKSSQGVYTKRRAIEGPLPEYPPSAAMEDLTAELLAAAAAFPRRNDTGPDHDLAPPDSAGLSEAATMAAESGATPREPRPTGPAAGAETSTLPGYQRDARDRLARRLKTVKKALEKLHRQRAEAGDEADDVRRAELLQEHLYDLAPGASELVVAGAPGEADQVVPLDPALTPGQNLAQLFDAVKKRRRSRGALALQADTTAHELATMTADLTRLRQSSMTLEGVQAILRRYRLPLARQDGGTGGSDPAAVPYRTYHWRPDADPEARPLALHVGKSAADNDELCRQAKGNDYWLHAVGTTGSHVIIPARQFVGPPPEALLRAAATLALHYSKRREDRRGEVYVSRRSHLKKRKGMAPGLWAVDKAETRFLTYTEAEVQHLLTMTQP